MSFNIDPISIAIGLGIGFLIAQFLQAKAAPPVNPFIQKESPKVATMCPLKDIEDLVGKKGVASYCRCWRSEKFPMCDGSHAKYNQESGDNAGPLVIKK
jgi:CDGSH-type Zn-finger protein